MKIKKKYGRFEIRAKAPAGNGFLPAIWMMPTNESLYGQWPKCGEIDIMEVLGSQTNKTYGTLHFGEPHAESQGSDRMKYWTILRSQDDVQVAVTNENNERMLKVVVPEDAGQTVVKQDVAMTGDKRYVLTFDAYADKNQEVCMQVAGETFTTKLSADKKGYKYIFDANQDVNGSVFEMVFEQEGTYYIDNVRIQEDALLINGDFSNGLTGYEVYAYTSDDVTYVVDSQKEDDAFSIDIRNTGDQDWKIQLKQNDITLKEDTWYKISFKAKSTLDRKIMYALQRDGSGDDNWIPYSGTEVIDLSSNYQTYEKTFQMKHATDYATILSISMGAVEGKQIDDLHTVVIDDICLEEVDEPTNVEEPDIQAGENMLQNVSFADNAKYWISAITAPGKAEVSFEEGKAIFDIKEVGTADWNVQLKQDNLFLEKGCSYQLTCKISSTAARTVKIAFLDPIQNYKWYDGIDVQVTEDQEENVNYTFTVREESDENIEMVISMGKIDGENTPTSVITLQDLSLIKLDDQGQIMSLKDEVEEQTDLADVIENEEVKEEVNTSDIVEADEEESTTDATEPDTTEETTDATEPDATEETTDATGADTTEATTDITEVDMTEETTDII